jgi:hypothetical protein
VLRFPSLQCESLTFAPIVGALNVGVNLATTLEVDEDLPKDFLLKFTVSGVNGQTVTNAKIRLYNVDAATKGGDFYQASSNSWQEGLP